MPLSKEKIMIAALTIYIRNPKLDKYPDRATQDIINLVAGELLKITGKMNRKLQDSGTLTHISVDADFDPICTRDEE